MGTRRFFGVILIALAALVSCTGCAADADANADAAEHASSTQQAITNGDDDGADPAVVALMSNGQVYCTGVLVTPTVVVTAAHCVVPSAPDQVYFGFRPSSKKGTFIAVSDSRAHPDFDEDTLQNDIAVVGLAQKASARPLDVITKELDSSYKGRALRVVGFGASGPNASDLRKRTGVTSIESYGDDDLRFRPTPSGTCVGDSGGPALVTIGDREAVVGITSSGDADCKVYGRDMRVDRYVPFIRGYAKAYSLPIGPATDKGCSVAAGPQAPGSSAAALLLVVACAAGVCARRRQRFSASLNRSSMR